MQRALNLFGARKGACFSGGPLATHPAQPGTIFRLEDGTLVPEYPR